MNSLMIAAHCKSMSRLEIIYTCVLNCIRLVKETGNELLILEEMRHYIEVDDLNQVIYYVKSKDVEPRLEKVLNEARRMKEIVEDDEWHTFSQYQLLIRVLNEQTNNDGSIKDKKEIKVDSLQNRMIRMRHSDTKQVRITKAMSEIWLKASEKMDLLKSLISAMMPIRKVIRNTAENILRIAQMKP